MLFNTIKQSIKWGIGRVKVVFKIEFLLLLRVLVDGNYLEVFDEHVYILKYLFYTAFKYTIKIFIFVTKDLNHTLYRSISLTSKF